MIKEKEKMYHRPLEKLKVERHDMMDSESVKSVTMDNLIIPIHSMVGREI